MAGAGAAVLALIVEPEKPDINDAKVFLTWYFNTAPHDPAATYGRLTPEYAERLSQQADNPTNLANYTKYFRRYELVTIEQIRQSDDEGWYRGTVKYYEDKNSKPRGPSYQVFDLCCPSRTKLPLISCGANNIELNSVLFEERPTPPPETPLAR